MCGHPYCSCLIVCGRLSVVMGFRVSFPLFVFFVFWIRDVRSFHFGVSNIFFSKTLCSAWAPDKSPTVTTTQLPFNSLLRAKRKKILLLAWAVPQRVVCEDQTAGTDIKRFLPQLPNHCTIRSIPCVNSSGSCPENSQEWVSIMHPASCMLLDHWTKPHYVFPVLTPDLENLLSDVWETSENA